MSGNMMEQRAGSTDGLKPDDAFVLRLLGQAAAVGPDKVTRIVRWWEANREEKESLAGFLVRREVFAPQAVKTVDMMRRGYVQFKDCMHLICAGGLDRLAAQCDSMKPETRTDMDVLSDDTRPLGLAGMRQTLRVATVLPPAPFVTRDEEPASRTVAVPVSPARSNGAGNGRLEPGTVLGKCLIMERLGQGASGLVFRALHQSLNIPVAVKVLHRSVLDQDPGVAEQLRREARLLAQLNHPNLIRVWDYDDSGEFPYVVMECVEGMSLAELIEQSGRLRPDRALRFIAQVADGLSAAHRLGMVHRDVKPANVLITKDGSAKLADLGLALVCSEALRASTNSPVEQAGLAGTAAYMAPEQIRDASHVDQRTDIYALGATAYHAVTGQMPFKGRSPTEVMFKHIREEPVPPEQVEPSIRPETSRLILRMMAKALPDRYQSCEDVLVALAAATLEPAEPAGTASTGTGSSESNASRSRKSVWRRLLSSFSRSELNELKDSP
ncbi:MAG: serine/threonine protein kinase [Gemmataceae bacterium]|nr:serine/threonine protein kinase [Gemmataceae bacterium]